MGGQRQAIRMYRIIYGTRDHFGLHHVVTWESARTAKEAVQNFREKCPWNTVVGVRWDQEMTERYRADHVDRTGTLISSQ